ncbi:MAG TPA: TIGR03435 family protein [Bryobacteraceae bacterium]|nr:TIGR03435 family protein [Bryobacteraceae bacterium]
MLTSTRTIIPIAVLAAAVSAQPRPAFEAASIRPSAPIDGPTMMAMIRSGKMPLGAHVTASRAEYTYLDLKTLLTYAYGVKTYQITGPDWMSSTRFDIAAKLPAGATKSAAPRMLQTLLENRFKLTFHRTTQDHPVLAIVVAKGGPKLKASAEKPVSIDEDAPLKPGEINMDTPDGPVRGRIDMATMSSVIDMGVKGKMAYKINQQTKSVHIDFMMTTLSGFADITTQLLTQIGGIGARRIVDATGIEGNYDASLDISLAEVMAMARSSGIDMPQNTSAVASDPGSGGATLAEGLHSMGLKLESRKAPIEQFIVDHIEKTPTEN